jgi:hypothetical protein
MIGNNVDGGDIDNPRTRCWTPRPIYHSKEEIHAVSNMHELRSKELVSSSNRRLKYLFFVKSVKYLHPQPDPRILVFFNPGAV